MIIATLLPIVLVAVVFLHYLLLSVFYPAKSVEARIKRSQRYTHMFLLITYIVVIGSSTKAILYFKCEAFVFPDGSSARYLAADMSIDCDGDEWNRHAFYAAAMILIYPVGIPLLYFVMVRRHRDILSDDAKIEEEQAKGSPTIGSVYFLVDQCNLGGLPLRGGRRSTPSTSRCGRGSRLGKCG